jgi:hypothetical protein
VTTAEADLSAVATPAHRVAVALVGVGAPVIAGLAASIAIWNARGLGATGVSPVARVTATAAAPMPRPQTYLRDGSVMIPWPLTKAPLHFVAGQEFEIVLYRLPRENIQILETPVLDEVPVPPCHLISVCGLPDVNRWAFVARLPGSAPIFIDYGPRCKPSVCPDAATFLTVTVGAR